MEFTEILALLTAKFSGTRKDVLTNIAKAFAMAVLENTFKEVGSV